MYKMLLNYIHNRKVYFCLLSLILLLFFSITSNHARSSDEIIISHGISTFGELKYKNNFQHLDYVNPNAPKGGEVSIWAFGSFDSMHPYTTKGRAGSLSSAFFESLLTGTADEIDSALNMGDRPLPPPPENPMSADRVRWEHIQRVFQQCDCNVSETARRLGMHRRTLQRILAKYSPNE